MARTRNATRALLAVILATTVLVGGIAAANVATSASAATSADGPTGANGLAAANAGAQDCSFPMTVTDATGTEVTIEEEPGKVVTTNPSAAQTMWEIGARDKVVGVTKFAAYLEGADGKTNISGAGYTTVVTEKVVALEPDLVLVPNATFGHQSIVQDLRDAGLTVYHYGASESLADIREKTLLTGQLVGECEGAQRSADAMDAELETVREAVEGEDRPRVLYVLGPDGYVAAQGTFIHTALEAAGATNIAAEQGLTGYPQISPEVVAEANPDWIVKPEGVPLPDSAAYNGTTAIQEGNVLEVNRNHINQPAPRIVGPIRSMAKTFHPDAYAAANATGTQSPAPTETPSPTATGGTPHPSPTSTDGPGFGLAAGLAAVLLAFVLTYRD